jgi:hypothetical protein
MAAKPSAEDYVRFDRLLAATTPSRAAYDTYRARSDTYLRSRRHQNQTIQWKGTSARLVGVRFHRSALYSRDYLIAQIEAHWFLDAEPGLDAMAGDFGASSPTPPLVLITSSRKWFRSSLRRSIIEHEIVHINQMLLGTHSTGPPATSVRQALRIFFRAFQSEYDAHSLQLIKWPSRLVSNEWPGSFHGWCVFRGWISAVESVVRGECCTRAIVPRLLSAVRRRLPEEFAALGIPEQFAPFFAGGLHRDVGTAIEIVGERAGQTDMVRAARAWLGKQS